MKNSLTIVILFLAAVCLADGPVIQTTPYSRTILTSPDATTARNRLGLGIITNALPQTNVSLITPTINGQAATGGTFNLITANNPTVNGGNFNNPTNSGGNYTGGNFANATNTGGSTAGGTFTGSTNVNPIEIGGSYSNGKGNFLTLTQSVVSVDCGQWITNTYFSTSPNFAGVSATIAQDAAWKTMLGVLTNLNRQIIAYLPIGFFQLTNAPEVPPNIYFVGHGGLHMGGFGQVTDPYSYTVMWINNTNSDGPHIDADYGHNGLFKMEVCGRSDPTANIQTFIGDPFYAPKVGVLNNSIYGKVGVTIKGLTQPYCGGVYMDDVVISGFKVGLWNTGNYERFRNLECLGNDLQVVNGGVFSVTLPANWPALDLNAYLALHDASMIGGGLPDQVAYESPSFGYRSNSLCMFISRTGVTIQNSSCIYYKNYAVVYGTSELTMLGGHDEPDQYGGTNLVLGLQGPGNSIDTKNWFVSYTVNGGTNIYGDNMTNWTPFYDSVNPFRHVAMTGQIVGVPNSSDSTHFANSPFLLNSQLDFDYLQRENVVFTRQFIDMGYGEGLGLTNWDRVGYDPRLEKMIVYIPGIFSTNNWPLNFAPTLWPSSDNQNAHATPTNGLAGQGMALPYNNSLNYFSTPELLNTLLTNFTASLWLQTTDAVTFAPVFFSRGALNSDNRENFFLYCPGGVSNQMNLIQQTSSGITTNCAGTIPAYNDGQWHSIALQMQVTNGFTSTRIYFDQVVVINTVLAGIPTNYPSGFLVGPIKGNVDEIKAWQRMLNNYELTNYCFRP